MEAAEAYWLNQFADAIPVLRLPADGARPSMPTYHGARQYMRLDASLDHDLKRLTAQHNCTSFVGMLASFNLLLAHLTGQRDFVLGIHAAGQLATGAPNLMGYWLNLLPLRSQVPPQPSFAEYLQMVKRHLLDAYHHQSYPLGRLIKRLNPRREPGRPSLIAATFNVDRAGAGTDFFNLEVETVTNHNGHAKFDLSVNILEGADQLQLEFDYNTDLFNEQTVRGWMETYELILRAVIARPHLRLDEFEQELDETEARRRLLKEQEFRDSRRAKLKNIKRKSVV
jgi:non-ribosomal peptide synthetase component F